MIIHFLYISKRNHADQKALVSSKLTEVIYKRNKQVSLAEKVGIVHIRTFLEREAYLIKENYTLN